MTEQEVILRIKDHAEIHKLNEPQGIYISEALEIAIEALKGQAIRRGNGMSDDLISRGYLLSCVEYDDNWRLVIPYEEVVNAPTAFDKERVIEELKKQSNNYYPSIDHYCLSRKAVNLKDALKIVEKGGI